MTEKNFDICYSINSRYFCPRKAPNQFNYACSGKMFFGSSAPVQQTETEVIGLAMAEQVDLEEDDDAADDHYFCDLCDKDDPAVLNDSGYFEHSAGEPLDQTLASHSIDSSAGHWKWGVAKYLDTQMGYSSSTLPRNANTDSTAQNTASAPPEHPLEPACSPRDSDVEYHPEQEAVEDSKPTRPSVRKRSSASSRYTGKRQRPHRESYVCQVQTGGVVCGKMFGRPYDLERHADIHNPNRQTFHCRYCPGADKLFSRQDALTRHMKNTHGLDE